MFGILQSGQCAIGIYRFNPYLDNLLLNFNFSFMGLPAKTGFIKKDVYYIVGEEGIQIVYSDKNCEQDIDILWLWKYKNWETGIRYKTFSGIIEKNFVYKVTNDKIFEFLFPGTYGGMWYGKVSLDKPVTIKRIVHWLKYHYFVQILWILTILYLVSRKWKIVKRI